MTIEASLDKNSAQIGELIAAVKENTATMQTLIEGRKEAMETLIAADAPASKPAPRSRKKADAEPTGEPAAAPSAETTETPPATGWNPDLSEDGVRQAATAYLTATSDEAEKAKRVGNVKAILAEIGVDILITKDDKKGLESEDDRRKALFYIARFNAGLPVDFKADYDFNADPLTQDGDAADAGGDDLVG